MVVMSLPDDKDDRDLVYDGDMTVMVMMRPMLMLTTMLTKMIMTLKDDDNNDDDNDDDDGDDDDVDVDYHYVDYGVDGAGWG